MLTSYDTFRTGVDEFKRMTWSACIFDEAHRLKKQNTKLYEAAMKLPRGRRFGLTGTIMQNTYDELWCLMDWACPGSLGELKEFKTYYSKNMQQAQRFNVDNVTLGRAGGVFRTSTSTPPKLNRRTESARPYEHSPYRYE